MLSHDAVSSLALGLVELLVGLLDDLHRLLVALVHGGHATADGHPDGLFLDLEGARLINPIFVEEYFGERIIMADSQLTSQFLLKCLLG